MVTKSHGAPNIPKSATIVNLSWCYGPLIPRVLGFHGLGLGFIWIRIFRVWGVGFEVFGFGFRVEGLGFRV